MTEWLRHTQHLHYYSISYHVCYYYIWVYCLVGFPYFTDGFVLYYLTFLSLVEWRYLIFSSDYLAYLIINSVQFSHSVTSNSLRPYGLQYARLPCPSPPPRACSNSCPSSRWCHPTISSSVIPFSSYLPSFPASGSFPGSQFFTSGDQSIRASASASILPMNIQGWIPLGLTGLISLLSKGLSRVFSSNHSLKASPTLWSNSHIHTWLLEKSYLWLCRPLLAKWCLCFLICCLSLP